MSVLTFNAYMRPVLQSIEAAGPSHLAELRKAVLHATAATAEERALLTGGGQPLLQGRVDWAVTYLYHAGLLARAGRGVYELTPAGVAALHDGPEVITIPWLREQSTAARDWLAPSTRSPRRDTDPLKTPGEPLSPPDDKTPDETIDDGLRELQKAVASDLSEALATLSPPQFERLAVILLTKMGYASPAGAAYVTPPAGDGGIDGVLYADPLGLQPLYMQAKWWESGATVPRPEIDKFLGVLTRLGATAGVFVTSSAFSAGAKNAVHGLQTRIKLIDREELLDLMFRFDAGAVRDRTLETKRFDPGFFETL